MPKVSIILTSFNHARWLRDAIESALQQTFQDFEIIIWDDASSDDSWQIIQDYAKTDKRILAFRNPKRQRGTYGINKAISEVASGEYVAIHHSDDIWAPDKLEKQVQTLDTRRDLGAVFTWVDVIDDAGQIVEDNPLERLFAQSNKTRHEWLRHFLLSGNALCHPSILIRKQCYRDGDLIRFGLWQLPDFNMWIRLCMKYEIHVIPEPLTRFRWHGDGSNTSTPNPATLNRHNFEQYLILENYERIEELDDVLKILPWAEKYLGTKGSDVDFVLARALLDITTSGGLRLFALKKLFDILADPIRAARVDEWHHFDYRDFREVAGKAPIFVTHTASIKGKIFRFLQRRWRPRFKNYYDLLNDFTWMNLLRFVKQRYHGLVRKARQAFARRIPGDGYCPVCASSRVRWLPLPDYFLNLHKQHGYSHTGEMTAVETYMCPFCGASDRERLYAFFLGAQKDTIGTKTMLHFAPEPALSAHIRGKQYFASYKTADMSMAGVDYCGVDLQSLPFDDECCDFYICSHVLEHVTDDRKAIRELYRITKPGGSGLLMAPIATDIEKTLEDPSITDENERWRLFGQNDHVRLYSHDDYVTRIEESGYVLRQMTQNDFGEEIFNSLGLKCTSILYVVSKPQRDTHTPESDENRA